MRLRSGALRGESSAGVHQFVAYAAVWEPLPDDGLPRHDESASVD